MNTEERLENLERELACAKRRNRRVLTLATVCLGIIFAWVFLAQPGLIGTAQASDPANPYEAEITRLQADVNLLKRENERLRKELEEAKKDRSAVAPTDAKGPSTPQPAATPPPGSDKPPAAVAMPGLSETDSSWWRDPVALATHMQLRVAMSATKPQASVWVWLQRNNYFAEQPVQWEVRLDNLYVGSTYLNKDSASIEYYKCLSEMEKIGKEAEKFGKDKIQSDDNKDEAARLETRTAWFREQAKAWKMMMDAGGGVYLGGSTCAKRDEPDLPVFRVHIVLPGVRSMAYATFAGQVLMVRVQGKIIAVGAVPESPATSAGLTVPSGLILQAALTGKVTILSKTMVAAPPVQAAPAVQAAPPVQATPPAPEWRPCPACKGSGIDSSIVCSFCNGTGTNGNFGCGLCKGRGFPPCSRCKGKGMVSD